MTPMMIPMMMGDTQIGAVSAQVALAGANQQINPISPINEMQPAYLTMQEVCTLLRLSRPTIRVRITRGEIAAFKVGRKWRFPAHLLPGAAISRPPQQRRGA